MMDDDRSLMAIDVITYSKNDYCTVDHAEAEGPEAALVAARTLLGEAYDNDVEHPRAAFYADDQMVRCDVTLREISDVPQFDCDWAFRDPLSAASRAADEGKGWPFPKKPGCRYEGNDAVVCRCQDSPTAVAHV